MMNIVTEEQIAEAVKELGDLNKWNKQCHAASLHVVKSGTLGSNARVARGWHKDVSGQHSWVVLGDPYSPDYIFDPTLWCYNGSETPQIYHGDNLSNQYRPHGSGHFVEGNRPPPPKGEIITLNKDWSKHAKRFFRTLGHSLDIYGWHCLAKLPVMGWPSSEIITAMYEDKRTSALVPIDVVGMLTDKNPNGLYF